MATSDMNQELATATVFGDLYGAAKTQAIRLAVLLRLPDLVKDGPRSFEELAQETGTNTFALYRLLYALANNGYFEEVEPGVFAQSQLSYTLRTDIPQSLANFAILMGDDWAWQLWKNALKGIQTGKEVTSEMLGKDIWSYFREDDPEAGEHFALAMRGMSEPVEQAIASGYDFSSAGTIIDVAGGQGSLLTTILQRYPAPRGVLFDQAQTIEMARRFPSINELQDRLTLVSGNFFEAIPTGGDIYTLKQIIHDWEDKEAIQILSNCRQAMSAGSRVLVIDELIAPGAKVPPPVALLDLILMLFLQGRKRSEAEYSALFEAAGLRLAHVYPTESSYTILEGVLAETSAPPSLSIGVWESTSSTDRLRSQGTFPPSLR